MNYINRFFFFFILWKFPHSGGPWPYLRLPGIWALCLGTTCLICLGGRQLTSNYRDVNASFSLFQLPWLLGRHITGLASQMYPQGFSTRSLGCREQREHPLATQWDFSSPTRIKPQLSAMRAWSPNHWTARELPGVCLWDCSSCFLKTWWVNKYCFSTFIFCLNKYESACIVYI